MSPKEKSDLSANLFDQIIIERAFRAGGFFHHGAGMRIIRIVSMDTSAGFGVGENGDIVKQLQVFEAFGDIFLDALGKRKHRHQGTDTDDNSKGG